MAEPAAVTSGAAASQPTRPAGWRWAFRIATAWSIVSLAGVLVSVGLDRQADALGGALQALPVFLTLSAVSFALRLLRWHRLICRITPTLGLAESMAIGTIGVALTITPGRVGEILKFRLVEEATGHRLWHTAPIALIEKIAEAAGFLALLALGAAWLEPAAAGSLGLPALALPATAGALILMVSPIIVRHAGGRFMSRVAAPTGWRWRLHALLQGFLGLSTPLDLVPSVGLTIVARAIDTIAIWWLLSMLGVPLGIAPVAVAFAASSFAAGVSFLPGGLGIAEAGMSGLLVAFGAPLPAAVAASLLSRVGSLWIWIVVGLVLAVRWKPKPYRPDSRR